MLLDRVSLIEDAGGAASAAREAEAAGYDGWFVGEAGYDAFLAAALAADATSSMTIGTAVAVAFARTPMTVAYAARDLMSLSGGRFVLGLGSQIKAHIQRRFAMPWSSPAARMREFITATRAILTSWEEQTPLDFRGEHYQHTLMSPFFAGKPHGRGLPPIALAAVGPKMTAVAGSHADILLAHPFTTPAYLTGETLPALRAGAEAAGRDPAEVQVAVNAFVVTGRTEQEMDQLRQATRAQLAFYASTPAYVGVLDSIGRAELQPELQRLSREGRWADMSTLIDEDMLASFAVVTEDPDEAGRLVADRYHGLADRVAIYPTWTPDADATHALRRAFPAAS